MTNIESFQDFLTSLAEISRWQFEIREGRDTIFATVASGGPPLAEKEALLSTIVSGETFRQTTVGGDRLLAGVPLRDEGALVGTLVAWNTDSRNSSPSDVRMLEVFLWRVAEILQDGWTSQRESEKLAEELSRSFEDLYLYARISGQVKALRYSDDMLAGLIGDILQTMRADLAFIRLEGRREGGKLIQDNRVPDRIADVPGFVDRLIDTIPEKAESLSENYFVLNDSREISGFRELHTWPFRALMVMVKHNENDYGWVGVVSFNLKEIFRRSELRLTISIAEQVAVVLSNTDLYHDLEHFVINVVKSLVYAIEAKDTYTRGHSERVNRYCMLMAEKLDMDENQRNHLHWASILHDIGKIGIPEGILNKPDCLTEEEYVVIKSHPAKGYNILKPLEPLAGSLPGILYHHERYEGGGYPDGLRGEEIPLMARIIAVGDTFDAINSNRAYRLAKSPQQTLGIVKTLAGNQLDPELVRIFAEVIGQPDGFSDTTARSGLDEA